MDGSENDAGPLLSLTNSNEYHVLEIILPHDDEYELTYINCLQECRSIWRCDGVFFPHRRF